MADINDKQAEMSVKENEESFLDYLFIKHETRAEKEPQKISISIEQLHSFPNHPYKVLDDESMDALAESIRERGIMTPILVCPCEQKQNEYNIISGHRRVHAAKRAGLKSVPAYIFTVSRDEAAIMVVDSNLNRERILPSEKAFGYKLKYEALKHQGKRTDLTSGQFVPKLNEGRTAGKIGEENGESYKTVQRYIRLTNLIPKLLEMMDKGTIAFSVGVELSYLPDKLQYAVLNEIESSDGTPSYAQANRMHKELTAGTLTEVRITEMMSAEKPNQKQKVSISMEKLSSYFRKDTSPKDIEAYILKLLEADRQRKRRAHSRDAR